MSEEAEKQAEIEKTVELLTSASEGEQSPEDVLEQLNKKTSRPGPRSQRKSSIQSSDSSVKASILGASMMACTLIGVFFIQSYVTPAYIAEREAGIGLVMKEIVALKPRIDNVISSLEQIEAGLMADDVKSVEPYLKVKMLSLESEIKTVNSEIKSLSKSVSVMGEDAVISYGVLSKTSEEIRAQIEDLGQIMTNPEVQTKSLDANENNGYRYKWKRDNKQSN